MHFVYIYIVLTALQNNEFVFVYKYDLETKFVHLILFFEKKVRVFWNFGPYDFYKFS